MTGQLEHTCNRTSKAEVLRRRIDVAFIIQQKFGQLRNKCRGATYHSIVATRSACTLYCGLTGKLYRFHYLMLILLRQDW
jgi:hypothetical protein